MDKEILILGTVDTKGELLKLLRQKIFEMGCKPLLMDLSMGYVREQFADITSDELLFGIGEDAANIRSSRDRGKITDIMVKAAQKKTSEILSHRDIRCIASMGGVSMAFMASRIMREVPFGVPKAMLVTAAMPAYISEWFGAMDIGIFQSIVDFSGDNEMVRNAIYRFSCAICGMALAPKFTFSSLPYPSVAITELGFSPNCARIVEEMLREKGFHVYSFHAQGISDRTMDKLLREGYFDGIIDIVTAGLIEEIFKGTRAAGMERLGYLSKRDIPKVLAPAALNITNCEKIEKKRYKGKKILKVDGLRSYVRYSVSELKEAAKVYADKLNTAKPPTVFFFPKKGLSSLDKEGSLLHVPEEDMLFLRELKRWLHNSEVEIIEMDCNLEDDEFAISMVNKFYELHMQRKSRR